MPVEIRITNTDIKYAEHVLLPEGQTFDDERKAFIKNLNTIDLQAVPGSGKTTALLAKLLILEQYMPFDDGSGILVISHTNAAIEEIKEKLQEYCPQLFSYPNFIGTIQSFVNQFLAIPFYCGKYKKRPIRIDNEIYEEKALGFSSVFLPNFTRQEQNNAKSYLRVNDLYKTFRYSHENEQIILTTTYNGTPLSFNKPRGRTRPQNYVDWTDHEKNRVKAWLFRFKKGFFRNGFLCFDDAYILGFQYLNQFPQIKTLLQKRFQLVFVDEMQDMAKHQHDILEQIFFDSGNSTTKFQRIGDKNQAIFNGMAELIEVWTDRETKLELNGSYRLSPKIARVVQPFAISPITIEGRGKNEDGSEIEIPPHLIVFDDSSQEEVITKFRSTIQYYQSQDEIPIEDKQDFFAIAWNTKPAGAGKMRIGDYFTNFSRERHRPRIDHQNLENYLTIHDQSDKSILKLIHDNILNAFLRILRLENIVDENDRAYTKQKLLSYLKENKENESEVFKLKIYQWSTSILKQQYNDVLTSIRAYIPDFLQLFGKTIANSCTFINENEVSFEVQDPQGNVFKLNEEDDIKIQVTTVHGVKGKTHTATGA